MHIVDRLKAALSRNRRSVRKALHPHEAVKVAEERASRFVVIDVETTGLSPRQDRILEIALVTADSEGAILDEWSTRFDPEGPVGAMHIHGIRPEDVVGAPLFRDVIPELNRRMAGGALCAHNAKFDLAFVRHEYRRAGWVLPDVPSVCTLDASIRHLPDLPRRRLTDCAAAVGHELERAHSARHDALAAAGLLKAFLATWTSDVGRCPYRRLAANAVAVPWPVGPETTPATRPRGESTSVQPGTGTAPTLVHLLSRFSLVDAIEEGAPVATLAYLEGVAEAFEDGVLTPSERSQLQELGAVHELSAEALERAHHAFVHALATEAVRDGSITHAERRELHSVAADLRVDADLPQLLRSARGSLEARLSEGLAPLPRGWSHGEPLRVGDKVAFTGGPPAERDRLEQRATEAGVTVSSSVSRQTDLLVTDGSMRGTKWRKAAELGTRVVTPSTFAVLLAHVQPVESETTDRGRAHSSSTAHTEESLPTASSQEQSQQSRTVSDPTSSSSVGTAATPAQIRAWGADNGWTVGRRGRLPAELVAAYREAHDRPGKRRPT